QTDPYLRQLRQLHRVTHRHQRQGHGERPGDHHGDDRQRGTDGERRRQPNRHPGQPGLAQRQLQRSRRRRALGLRRHLGRRLAPDHGERDRQPDHRHPHLRRRGNQHGGGDGDGQGRGGRLRPAHHHCHPAATADGGARRALLRPPGAEGPRPHAAAGGDGSPQTTGSATASPITATHTYAAAGTNTVAVTVTDKGGAAGSGQLTITVTQPPPPTAAAGGPYSGSEGTAVSFDGSGSSDPGGSTLTYAWTFGDGTNGTGVKPTHTYPSFGSYTVSLDRKSTRLNSSHGSI